MPRPPLEDRLSPNERRIARAHAAITQAEQDVLAAASPAEHEAALVRLAQAQDDLTIAVGRRTPWG